MAKLAGVNDGRACRIDVDKTALRCLEPDLPRPDSGVLQGLFDDRKDPRRSDVRRAEIDRNVEGTIGDKKGNVAHRTTVAGER